ncbi:MAG TPA: hypothetical protein VN408_42185 [Actinoplanes sp.]|nr:hypothetical protein [Actinoplanes sp.]
MPAARPGTLQTSGRVWLAHVRRLRVGPESRLRRMLPTGRARVVVSTLPARHALTGHRALDAVTSRRT